MNAFLYLVATSGRNRVAGMVRRAKSPRYALALVIGGLYIWSFLVRPASAAGATSFLIGKPTETIATLLAAITLMGSWVFGSDATALAFSQAEVSMLFSAPLSRRSLIAYKLFRAQITVLFNALFWVFLLRRGGTLISSPLRIASLWVMFSTLNLHRLGAALVRSSWREHGRSGTRRHVVSVLVFVAVGLSMAWTLGQSRNELMHVKGVSAFFATLSGVLAQPPASWGLYPFRLVVAPIFAASSAEWSREIWPAILVMLAHAWWVLRTDAAFEDAAIEASAERARRLLDRSRRGSAVKSTPRVATSTIKLASAGHPALAIVWKNMLCLRRTSQLRVFLGPLAIAIATGFALADGRGDLSEIVATCAAVFAGALLLFGGRMIRNDLRQDMQHLPLLKTLPIDPTSVVLAEVASSALPMVAVQLLLVMTAFVAISASPHDRLGGQEMRIGLLVAAPFGIAALNAALLTIQNGTAVLFPGWIRLGPAVNTGVEALGQNVVASIANMFSLALALVLPVIAGLALWRALGYGPVVVTLAIIVAALLLAIETYGVMHLLGGALARAEPAQTE